MMEPVEAFGYYEKERVKMDEIRKFQELMNTDEEFQKKLKDALETYTGEKTDEAVFNQVLIPLASEYGITATYDEYKAYIDQLKDQELNNAEISQVAGGKSGGLIAGGCYVIGHGVGGGGGNGAGVGCALLGVGWGTLTCAGKGSRNDE